ncbi:MAG: hypothetical protein RR685_02695, partial [Hungatella sp.]
SNFSKITLDFSLLILCVIGFGCNWLMIGIGYLWNLRRSGAEKAFAMLNLSGYNIGNFTMPFVQSFLSPIGFAATSLFDAGNAIMCTGMTYTVAGMAVGEGEKPSLSSIAKKLFSSVPFDAYIVMTILAILKIRLPAVALSFAEVPMLFWHCSCWELVLKFTWIRKRLQSSSRLCRCALERHSYWHWDFIGLLPSPRRSARRLRSSVWDR